MNILVQVNIRLQPEFCRELQLLASEGFSLAYLSSSGQLMNDRNERAATVILNPKASPSLPAQLSVYMCTTQKRAPKRAPRIYSITQGGIFF